MLLALLTAMTLVQTTAAGSPLAGSWSANLAKSQLRPNAQVRSESLQVVVGADNTLSISDSVVTTAGREVGQGTTTFRVDGEAHSHDELLAGLTVVARWRGPRMLETVLTRRNGQIDRVTYEVSEDGHQLTVKTEGDLGGQLIVFERR